MKKMTIDKDVLKGYKTLSIGLENCDVYEIPVKHIVDIFCEAECIHKKRNEYSTSDGFIKISAKASNTVECMVLREKEMGTKWDYRLKERLEMCHGGADMTSFYLMDKEGRKIEIRVPYAPLEDIIHGTEIELSNCPSLEIDDAGNMLIKFGESSKQPKRKDNNYDELIEGWQKAFGDYSPKILRGKATSFSTFGRNRKNSLFSFELRGKKCRKEILNLVFLDCCKIDCKTFFSEKRNCEIVMSKMADGRIYVGFLGLEMDFICASVMEYDYYCKRNTE